MALVIAFGQTLLGGEFAAAEVTQRGSTCLRVLPPKSCPIQWFMVIMDNMWSHTAAQAYYMFICSHKAPGKAPLMDTFTFVLVELWLNFAPIQKIYFLFLL